MQRFVVPAFFFLTVGCTALRALATEPTCADCWCIAYNNTNTCPDWKPKMNYSSATIAALAMQVPVNPFSIDCNPYKDPTCRAVPTQQMLNVTTAVCGIKYTSSSCEQYRMETYMNVADAEKQGAFVSHYGACGVCSTTQDLSAYLNYPDMTSQGKECAALGLINEKLGIECYQKLGFTEQCSTIWMYDGTYDGSNCFLTCIENLGKPNNGPAPECALNPCLDCDEQKAGPLFKQIAARTRRRSGLISAILRPCDSVAKITHVACPYVS